MNIAQKKSLCSSSNELEYIPNILNKTVWPRPTECSAYLCKSFSTRYSVSPPLSGSEDVIIFNAFYNLLIQNHYCLISQFVGKILIIDVYDGPTDMIVNLIPASGFVVHML